MSEPFVGLHYDIARGAYLKPEVFLEAIRTAADAGFTHFLPYLENMIRLPSSEKACPHAAYGHEAWRRFEAESERLGLELVPHFNVIGHSAAWCRAYPELGAADDSCGGEMDPTKPAVRTFVAKGLREFCAISRSRHFLIGGDEWQPPRRLLREHPADIGRIWVDQLNFAVKILREENRRPLLWHDALLHHPECWDRLSREAVVLVWHYDLAGDYPLIEHLHRAGFDVVLAPGACSTGLSRRYERTLAEARVMREQYRPCGLLFTNWENVPWAQQKAAIVLAGRRIRGLSVPDVLTRTWSAVDLMNRLVSCGKASPAGLREKIMEMLSDAAWAEFPDARAWIRAGLANELSAQRERYLRDHAAEGPLYASLAEPLAARPLVAANAPVRETAAAGFGVCEEDNVVPILRFVNGHESFAVFPSLGASLQDWRIDQTVVIPRYVTDALIAEQPLPGGFMSYARVLGFRPCFCAGLFHIPNMAWQYPWQSQIAVNAKNKAEVECRLDLPHVTLVYRIGIRRGTPGFVYTVSATNKLAFVYGAFGWNLPIRCEGEHPASVKLRWQAADGSERCLGLLEREEPFQTISVASRLAVSTPEYELAITLPISPTVLFGVDFGKYWITPDLIGSYRKLRQGETIRRRWHFRATRT